MRVIIKYAQPVYKSPLTGRLIDENIKPETTPVFNVVINNQAPEVCLKIGEKHDFTGEMLFKQQPNQLFYRRFASIGAYAEYMKLREGPTAEEFGMSVGLCILLSIFTLGLGFFFFPVFRRSRKKEQNQKVCPPLHKKILFDYKQNFDLEVVFTHDDLKYISHSYITCNESTTNI